MTATQPPAGPAGFQVHTSSAGLVEDGRDDLTVVVSQVPARSSAVFTRSRFAGPSVRLSRESARAGTARGVVVLARNANVATGADGAADAAEVRARVAGAVGLPPEQLLVASTGIIGVRYPMPRVRAALDRLAWPFGGADFEAAARAIMTTDTRPKLVRTRCGPATIVGIAKGVGMIAPDLATLLGFFFTDADLPQDELDRGFRAVMARTFNAVSIDTDTSTSDTAAVFANGLAGPVDPGEFQDRLHQVALELTRQIARDGEGASKLIEVRVTGARDEAQAKRVARAVVDSPLVKTAVHGSDPNWGRVAMAIGKCQDDLDLLPERITIAFGDLPVYPDRPEAATAAALAAQMAGDEVVIQVGLGIADGAFTAYGCDLTEGYIRINASYST
jgi:glutamate N-acetyltransferase/amino-acid N-acetyltransferase